MLKFALAGIVGIVATGLMAGPISAQSKMDCNAAYKGFLETYNKDQFAAAAPDKLAETHRLALRAYDACQAGDEFNAKAFFDAAEKNRT